MKRTKDKGTVPMFWPVLTVKLTTLRETEVPYAERVMDTPEAIVKAWQEVIERDPRHSADVESLYSFHLNTRRHLIGVHLIAQGLLDTILCHPREVYRSAIVNNAAAVVLIHNHPSGDPTPSEADVRVTREMIRAGQLLKIECLDHVVIGKATEQRSKAWSSQRELGYFYQQ